ncbi:MAG: AAA family ATPase [Nitrososphaerota archaeon]|nr:AAA family ATPase [Candidatus Bathyarchaeota archaeon]MDW8049295.1 AAA family ATPase [Nitrososphaerota archaeon]
MRGSIRLELKNIGCLRRIELDFEPGLNIIRAPNASGKTSLVRGFASIFSEKIPPEHVLSLNEVEGIVRVRFRGRVYERTFRRTPSGSVVASGSMLPFSDNRAFDACVAMAESGVVHKITGGSSAFREYLEELSYGKYYSTIISSAQGIVNELSRELAGPSFRKFESLPLLIADIAEIHAEKERVSERIRMLRAGFGSDSQSLLRSLEEKKSSLAMEEMRLSDLRKDLDREREREDQLINLLGLADESLKVAARIKQDINICRDRQMRIRDEVERQSQVVHGLRSEVKALEMKFEEKKREEEMELESLEREMERLNKELILKEEEIQEAERLPPDDPKYPGRLVVEVRREIIGKIDWLNMAIGYFQDKYMRRMTAARLRFNRNVNRAFERLGLRGFKSVFLDQDFALHIMRENGVRQPVDTLSASEKLTISLLLMLAAKETFLPDFPFFILDELTLSYDPERFRQITGYMRQRVPYVIVTSLTSDGGGIEVIHEG